MKTVPSGRFDFCMYGALAVGGTVGVGAFWPFIVDKPVGTSSEVLSAGIAVGAALLLDALAFAELLSAVAVGLLAVFEAADVFSGALSLALLVNGGRPCAVTESVKCTSRINKAVDGVILRESRIPASLFFRCRFKKDRQRRPPVVLRRITGIVKGLALSGRLICV